MSAWPCATNFVHASASPIGPAISFALMPRVLKYPILIGTQRSKSSITSSVPRGEIHRTVCSVAARPRAARTPESAVSPAPATAARLRKTPRVISLVNASSILSFIPPPFPDRTCVARGSRLPARPAFADEVEDDVAQDPEDRDDQDRRAELGHPRQRRVVDEVLPEPALLARGHHLAADCGQEAEDRADHEADDDHRQRERETDLREDLEGRG